MVGFEIIIIQCMPMVSLHIESTNSIIIAPIVLSCTSTHAEEWLQKTCTQSCRSAQRYPPPWCWGCEV